ncbi:UNVERIFIED_CONTAM: hypothetical protein GTU68_042949 [Idotea baltica]|nr:hypothetical protein [Idotea baltica]
MKVVILCGGQGTRLGEVTQGLIPKPLADVAGRPILWHIMNCYANAGFSDFIICAGYLGDQIRDYFRNYRLHNSDFRVHTATGEIEMLNSDIDDWSVLVAETGTHTMTAGRVARIAKYLDDDEPFFLTYGDGVCDVDLQELADFHRGHGKLATVTGVAPPGRFGELHLDGDQVAAFNEKPELTDRYINGGFMVLDRQFVDQYCAQDNADDITLEHGALESAAADDELMMFRHHGFWQCMDTMRDWELLNKLAASTPTPWA